MGVSVSTYFFYGVRIEDWNFDDYDEEEALLEKLREFDEERWEEGLETFQYSLYDEYGEPCGFGSLVKSFYWGVAPSLSEVLEKIEEKFTDERKEKTDKILDELNVPGKRGIYMISVMG